MKEAGCLIDPPVSVPMVAGVSFAAKAEAEPPEEPPGTKLLSIGHVVIGTTRTGFFKSSLCCQRDQAGRGPNDSGCFEASLAMFFKLRKFNSRHGPGTSGPQHSGSGTDGPFGNSDEIMSLLLFRRLWSYGTEYR